jgi:GNAT superfamily N-acetyltransferase
MKQIKEFVINEKKYVLITGYKDEDCYRASFNRLTQKTYGFDFETWYQAGWWKDNYIPYSFLYENEIVANVSVNLMEFLIQGKVLRPIQLGTVMTEDSHRNQGLIRLLMNTVLEEYEKTQDFIYLFANDTVLDFYPKFGFEKVTEYEYSKSYKYHKDSFTCQKDSLTFRKLHIDQETDRNLFLKLIRNQYSHARISMVNNTELIMFYCDSFMKEDIYYIETLNTAVIAQYDSEQVLITDLFSERAVDLEVIINTMLNPALAIKTDSTAAATDNVISNDITNEIDRQIRLGFTPLKDTSFTREVIKDADTTLFIRGNDMLSTKALLKDSMFPLLSHA